MKLKQILMCCTLLVSFSNADNVMKKSMSTMQDGLNQIQQGFLNNNIQSIRDGVELIKKGNNSFSNEKVIAQYLPENKKHMVNVAENLAKRISLNATVLELNLDEKSYINATNAYGDILNACSRCHGIVRGW